LGEQVLMLLWLTQPVPDGLFSSPSTLAQHFRTLGYRDVETFINSGDVVFRAKGAAATVEEDAQARLAPLLGIATDVFVRTPAQERETAARAADLVACLPSVPEVNVAFLKVPLDPAHQQALDTLRSELDEFVPADRDLIWLSRVRQTESRISNAVLERRAQIRTTLRRARMLQQLAAQLGPS
jgi:uncharacterized protein (DUF1697 family)